MFNSSCSSTSLSRYAPLEFFVLLETIDLNVCSSSSLRHVSCCRSRCSSNDFCSVSQGRVCAGGSLAHITVFHGVRTRSGLRVVQVRRLDKINDYGVERVCRQINTRKRLPTQDRLHDLKKLSQDNPAYSSSLHNHTFVFCILASRPCHVRTFVARPLHLREPVHRSLVALRCA